MADVTDPQLRSELAALMAALPSLSPILIHARFAELQEITK